MNEKNTNLLDNAVEVYLDGVLANHVQQFKVRKNVVYMTSQMQDAISSILSSDSTNEHKISLVFYSGEDNENFDHALNFKVQKAKISSLNLNSNIETENNNVQLSFNINNSEISHNDPVPFGNGHPDYKRYEKVTEYFLNNAVKDKSHHGPRYFAISIGKDRNPKEYRQTGMTSGTLLAAIKWVLSHLDETKKLVYVFPTYREKKTWANKLKHTLLNNKDCYSNSDILIDYWEGLSDSQRNIVDQSVEFISDTEFLNKNIYEGYKYSIIILGEPLDRYNNIGSKFKNDKTTDTSSTSVSELYIEVPFSKIKNIRGN